MSDASTSITQTLSPSTNHKIVSTLGLTFELALLQQRNLLPVNFGELACTACHA